MFVRQHNLIMEMKINFSQVPHGYPICLNRKCTQAGACLRQLIELSVPADIQCWTILSPTYLASLEGACPYYRSATKVRFAKGFIRLLEDLPYNQMRTVIAHLTRYFGQRTYYRVRKGERLLSPAEQQKVLSILGKYGVSGSPEFDAYVEEYDW